jgi:wyosine [tRNA(Phe)-imidazoG37] synthetase (radical SAM superfamily)
VTRSGSSKRGHVYGPVLSRRLGTSLGVDLVPFKTCDYDCIYCQLGRTTCKTAVANSFDSPSSILDELEERLSLGENVDYVTLSGSGEPTLNSDLEIVVSGIKNLTKIPVAILTNGSLLGDEKVAAGCSLADLVIPSLDAGDERTFQKMNRPARGLTLGRVVEGIESFRVAYSGQLWLEVMLVQDVNTDYEQIEDMRGLAERINPDRIQLNTVERPPGEAGIVPIDEGALRETALTFGTKTEFIADSWSKHSVDNIEADEGEITELLARRPCTALEISSTLEVHPAVVIGTLWRMLGEGTLTTRRGRSGVYYKLAI